MRLTFWKSRARLRREAANWLARLQGGENAEVRAAFERWRSRDPAHAEAFRRVERSYAQAGLLRHSPLAASPLPEHQRGRERWPALAAAAGLALALAGLIALHTGALPLGQRLAVMLVTDVGQIRRVRLDDGSDLVLDSATRVEVTIARSRRMAQLQTGRARFRIAEAKVPFAVAAGQATVETSGGVVEVEHWGTTSRVAVIEGRAMVSGAVSGTARPLAAGEAVDLAGKSAGVASPSLSEGDWTTGMLEFDRTPLLQAVARANRYSERQIRLSGDLHALRVTGAFRAGDTSGLARALAAAFGLVLREDATGDLVLERGREAGGKLDGG